MLNKEKLQTALDKDIKKGIREKAYSHEYIQALINISEEINEGVYDMYPKYIDHANTKDFGLIGQRVDYGYHVGDVVTVHLENGNIISNIVVKDDAEDAYVLGLKGISLVDLTNKYKAITTIEYKSLTNSILNDLEYAHRIYKLDKSDISREEWEKNHKYYLSIKYKK